MPKIDVAERTLMYSVPNGVSHIDLAKDLSALNRRFYRQGYNYVVESVQIATPIGLKISDIYTMTLSTAASTYMTHNAWKKGFKTWQRMQNEYADGSGARLKGKWADFKVLLDDSGASFLTPIAGDGGALSMGEWVYSNYVYDDAGTSRSPAISLIGTVTEDSHIALIEAYQESRNYPSSGPANETEVSTGFYAQFHGVGDTDDELGTDLRDDNDLPPYDQDDYYGGETNGDDPHPKQLIAINAANPMGRAPGFVAPCGLIEISTGEAALDNAGSADGVYGAGATATGLLLVTVAAGPYKGVLAAPMGQ